MPSDYSRPWRRGSMFGAGIRRTFSADDRRVWRARIELHRRAGRLTLGAAKVAEALLRRLGQNGRCDPSHETIANDAGLSVRTVRRALAALQAVGMVSWCRRIVRVGSYGCAQITNAYALALGSTPKMPENREKSSGGHSGRQILKKIFAVVAPLASPVDIVAARTDLAATRTARAVQLGLV